MTTTQIASVITTVMNQLVSYHTESAPCYLHLHEQDLKDAILFALRESNPSTKGNQS